ncbi:MAG TPA: hypothetical protein VL752_01915 [Acidisoma sp.]|nr:hypothetical protein [Acidisoma sp.]
MATPEAYRNIDLNPLEVELQIIQRVIRLIDKLPLLVTMAASILAIIHLLGHGHYLV